ncbi:hypothetical protein FJW00_14920 [Pantoea anthophila]|uniref:Uncharacterized protein n=2 Tax=Pantoea anthophila TaxID=470931 RepID=A0ABY2Z4Z4_9GAMM|nr:hypothetical protein FJW00_14920 [Pantoea anthophila]
MYNNLPALTDTLFWVDSLLNDAYATVNEDEFFGELTRYQQKIDALCACAHEAVFPSRLNVYMAGNNNMENYKSGLFSMDRVILDDRIYSFYQELSQSPLNDSRTKLTIVKKDRLAEIKQQLAIFVRFIKKNFELIRGEFICFIRKSAEYKNAESRKFLSQDNSAEKYTDQFLPEGVAALYRSGLTVRNISGMAAGNKIRVLDDGELATEIMMEIRNCTSSYVNGYRYLDIIKTIVREDGLVRLRLTSVPHQNRQSYLSWVQGARNSTIMKHYLDLLTTLDQATEMRASLGADCPFQGEVLRHIDLQNEVQRTALSIDVPFLEGLSPAELFRIRTEYADSFGSFRTVLRDAAYAMEAEDNDYARQLINRRFIERIRDEGLTDIEGKIHEYKRKSKKEVFINIAPSLIGFLAAPSAASLSTGAFELLKALFNQKGESSEIKKHPSYFLLKTEMQRCVK